MKVLLISANTLTAPYPVYPLGLALSPDGSTLYEIASIGKNFTAMLVFDAIKREEFALNDPVEQHDMATRFATRLSS